MTTAVSKVAIKSWMMKNAKDYIDDCGEFNCTALVESWDSSCSSGDSTLDPDHPAWDIAVDVAQKLGLI